jgi:hypothetical protein
MQLIAAPDRFLPPRISRILLEQVYIAAACFFWLAILSVAGFFCAALGLCEWLAPLRPAFARPI